MPEEIREGQMPFVVCASHGGPYEDEAFIAGFEMGTLDGVLALGVQGLATQISDVLLRQADMICFNRGYLMRATGHHPEHAITMVEVSLDPMRQFIA